MVRLDNDAWQAEQEVRIQNRLPKPKIEEKRRLTEREIRVAMLELRGEIRDSLAESSKKAPRWDSDANRVIIGHSPFPGGKIPKHHNKPLI